MSRLFFIILFLILRIDAVYTQTNQPTQPIKTGSFKLGTIDTIPSTGLNENRTLNIYLPETYSKDSADNFPVIYLLDGSANEDFVHIVGIVQFLTMIGEMPASIVVGIANVNRQRDFTFPTSVAQDKKDIPTAGGSAKFIAFIEKEVQPYIEKRYSNNASKTIIGQSLGGLLATEILIKKQELFNHYIIVSPSLWWDDESLLAEAEKRSKYNYENHTKVYVSVGKEGKQMEEDAKKLFALLQVPIHKNLQAFFVPMPRENHLTILHNSVYRALQILHTKTKI